jgi:hypothetical protein
MIQAIGSCQAAVGHARTRPYLYGLERAAVISDGGSWLSGRDDTNRPVATIANMGGA